jgi:hypothetical protein
MGNQTIQIICDRCLQPCESLIYLEKADLFFCFACLARQFRDEGLSAALVLERKTRSDRA